MIAAPASDPITAPAMDPPLGLEGVGETDTDAVAETDTVVETDAVSIVVVKIGDGREEFAFMVTLAHVSAWLFVGQK